MGLSEWNQSCFSIPSSHRCRCHRRFFQLQNSSKEGRRKDSATFPRSQKLCYHSLLLFKTLPLGLAYSLAVYFCSFFSAALEPGRVLVESEGLEGLTPLLSAQKTRSMGSRFQVTHLFLVGVEGLCVCCQICRYVCAEVCVQLFYYYYNLT